MSIPKEPRQLMINLMYLVLTALLALNVSAEVMNAFFDLDKSLTDSAKIAATGADDTKKAIQTVLDKKPNIKDILNSAIDEAKTEVDAFSAYIGGVKSNLIDASGNNNGSEDEGDYDEKTHKPKGKKNKDVTTRILVQEGKGDEIAAKVEGLKAKLVEIFEKTVTNPTVIKEAKIPDAEVQSKLASFKSSVALNIESLEEIQKKAPDKKSWAQYKFWHMPVAAVLPALTKFETDARNAQAVLTNKVAELVGGRELKLDKFFPVINAQKGYVIKGEPFKATVSVGAYSTEMKDMTVYINGQKLSLKNGVADFSENTSSTGKRKLDLKAVVVNPLTNETMTGTSTFEYEVGVRSATVSADKMNVFYIGVDNPLSVAVAGSSSSSVKVSCSGCNVNGSNGKYNVTASSPGKATINVSAEGLTNTPFEFRVKRIPDPVAMLGNESSGSMGSGEMQAQKIIRPVLEGFDFEARCEIIGYELTYVAKRQDPVTERMQGGRIDGNASTLTRNAKPGDIYYFDNVRAKCPGDSATRKINGMVFKIK